MTNVPVVRARRSLLALVAALALLGPGAAPQEDPTGSWTLKTSNEGFSQGATATDGTYLYVIAGMQFGTVSSFPEMFQQVRRYDPVGDSWTTLEPMPVAVYDTAAACVDGTIYCLGGGDAATGVPSAGIQEFSIASGTWANPAPHSLSVARQAHAAAALDGLIYVSGGYDGNNVIAGGEVFDPSSGTTAAIPDMPIAFQYHAMTALPDRLVVTTGYDALAGPVGDSLSYSPGAPGWVALATVADPRYGAASFALAGRVYVAGGFYDDAMASTWEYNPADNTWARRADLNNARFFHGAAAINGKGYVYGGAGVTTGEEYAAPDFSPPPPPSNEAPVANAGSDQTVEATSPSGASVTLDASGSTDADGDALTYSWSPVGASGVNPTVTLPIGENVLTLTVSDGESSSTDTVVITVVDSEAPSISVSASPSVLWSPNHDMRQIVLTATSSDAGDASPECEILSVTCNQAANGDIEITGDMTLNVRAERSNGETRIYTITVRCTDASGNSSQATTTVCVPHNQGNGDADANAKKAKK